MSRYDYIPYDEKSIAINKQLNAKVQELDALIEALLPGSREKALAITNLEQTSMWIGKAIKTAQEIRVALENLSK